MDRNGARLLYGVLNAPSTQVLKLLRGPASQSALALVMDLNQNSITDWECGRTSPSPSSLFDLLEHYMKWTGKLGWPALDLLLVAAAEKPEPPEPAPAPEVTPQ